MEFIPDYPVAFTSALLQSQPVEHRDMTAAVTDQTGALQMPGSFRDAFAAYTEHAGDQFLCNGQFIRRQTIQRQQQPAAQLLSQNGADCTLQSGTSAPSMPECNAATDY